MLLYGCVPLCFLADGSEMIIPPPRTWDAFWKRDKTGRVHYQIKTALSSGNTNEFKLTPGVFFPAIFENTEPGTPPVSPMRRVYRTLGYRNEIQSNDFKVMTILSSPEMILVDNDRMKKQLEADADPASHFDRFDKESLADHTMVETINDLMLSNKEWENKLQSEAALKRKSTIAKAIHGDDIDEKQGFKTKSLPVNKEIARQVLPVERKDLVSLYRLIDESVFAAFGMSRTMARFQIFSPTRAPRASN